jgi:hypothetical protein
LAAGNELLRWKRKARYAKKVATLLKLGEPEILVDRDHILCRSGEILYAPTGTDAAVMMNIEAGRYYGLNAAAVRIWELLESPRTVTELVAILCEEFEVEAPACESDVVKFVDNLIAHGIVHEAPA